MSEGIADLVELTEPDKVPDVIKTLNTFPFELKIMSNDGETLIQTNISFTITSTEFNIVKNQVEKTASIMPHDKREATRTIGVPITIDNQSYAMFIRIDYEEEMHSFKKVMIFLLGLVLFIGSLLILLASRHLVNPIKKLTFAAKEIAKGNFAVRLNSKNKDEVGELINSFNHMAAEVEKIDKMRENFVSSVSHEIQSPLTSIKGFTKAIRDEVVPKQNQKEYLDIIYQETERLSRLSENLLRLASLDSEHHPYHPTVYRLDEQIRRTVLATEPLWKQRNLTIELDITSIEIEADQDLFEQVWLNLLTNAIKYSHDNGRIIVEAEKTETQSVIKIKDFGKGIPQAEIPHLFKRFYKVDKARRSSIEGNGLGLSIVKKIVNIHKCTIDVSSKEGIGSTFTITIPNHLK
ncbi:sensor histidine kinase [Halalkalibacter krulwichiae]|uniref:sensor histidine kinase n=1 Tax=Halalkalibacter krulwichiae TaxID=199441 RepID=UPI001470FCE7|nr:HAMP domain-containing sensor histidine kinase [Halalkalibacter krulwichiae]